MTPEQTVDIARQAVWVMLKIGAPTLLVALIVGTAISLIQALTQLQETTLSFLPKLMAVLLVFVLTGPFVLTTLKDFTRELYGEVGRMGDPSRPPG